MKPGDIVPVTGFPYRDGRPAMAWLRMGKADGTEFPIPGFKKLLLTEFLQHHGKEISPDDSFDSLTPL